VGPVRLRAPLATAGCAAAVLLGCGGGGGTSTTSAVSTSGGETSSPASGAAAGAAAGSSRDWPLFGRTSDRAGATDAPSGVTAAGLARLRRIQVSLPGTVDSSPIYLHGVRVAGRTRDVYIATTTYGRTVAVDAASGRVRWTYTPAGIGGWEGS
jgi:hypothetical protein